MSQDNIKAGLRAIAESRGGRLFGVCRIDSLRDSIHSEIKAMSEKLNTAISVGIPLSGSILDTLKDHPNMLYKTHYQQVNIILNDISFLLASEIMRHGGKAVPIPASQILDVKMLRAHLSHREVAFKAGLGWRGRNNLLVCENYGSKVRLVTVLTDMQLEPDKPLKRDCGDCYDCLTVCPADAIAENPEDFDLPACYAKIQEFSKHDNYGHLICGLCLKCCNGNGE